MTTFKSLFNFLLFTNLLLIIWLTCSRSETRNYITNEFNAKSGEQTLSKVLEWRESYRKQIMENLKHIPESLRSKLLNKAKAQFDHQWPSITAHDYLQFTIDGDRYNYEEKSYDRRSHIADLVMGYLLNNNTLYARQILNGLWLVLEETSWVLPAHVTMLGGGNGLANVSDQVVDIISPETALMVSLIKLLMRDTLDKISPIIVKKIDKELENKIAKPFLAKHFDYMNASMNWNIWVETNVLQIALLAIDDTAMRNRIIIKAMQNTDNFLNNFPEDGGCDEGPHYWIYSGGRLIEFLEILKLATNGRLDWSQNQLINRIGSYIYKMHITSNRFVNFADSEESFAKTLLFPHRFYLYGKYFDNENMKQFGSYMNAVWQSLPEDESLVTTAGSGNLNELIKYVLYYPSIANITADVAPFPKQSYFPNLQVFTARSNERTNDGLFIGAKAGHNGESHNHNDVGSFVLYIDGKPAFIDVGVGNYTAQTFSQNRYDIWNLQSQWHNGCPTINGVLQHEGKQYSATNITFVGNISETLEFSYDLAQAYPKEAAVKSWFRKLWFNRGNNSLDLNDVYELTEWKQSFTINFITILNTYELSSNRLTLNNTNTTLIITFDDKLFDVSVEKRELTDHKLIKNWGNLLSRVVFTAKSENNSLTGDFTFKFSYA